MLLVSGGLKTARSPTTGFGADGARRHHLHVGELAQVQCPSLIFSPS